MWNPKNKTEEFASEEEFTQAWLNQYAMSINSRFYAPVPFEYYEEMQFLSNEEFGRLIRALLWFCMTGEMPEVDGILVHYISRVINRQRRFQTEWKALAEKRSDNGKKGAEARWKKTRKTLSQDSLAEDVDLYGSGS